MSYCLNSSCPSPHNPTGTNFCNTCGAKLLLKERYRAIKPIGQGGFGKTFLAVDEDKPSQPRCVIKQFFPQAQGTNTVQKAAELFTQEAVRLDELGKHPQIPELLAYFSLNNQQYLVQEFIDGRDLAQELANIGVFNETQIRQVLNNLLPVLQFVHEHQVIHRDIKPENIIQRNRDKQLVLVDFGASKVATSATLGRTGTVIGSAGYVAPEQGIGKAVFASDLYSLGVTCIHLLTQLHPFELFDVNEGVWVWRKFLKNPVNNQLGRILDKLLEGATNRRYQTAADVFKDLNPSSAPAAPTVKAKKQQPPPNSPATPPKTRSIIDDELAELKSQILGNPTPKNPSQKPASPTPPKASQSKSQIDLELEELKSQFLGSPNQKKPPSQI
ncbi:MAG: serine/threonine protein kinase [Kastovskya adunca ATA6-11-RM4]|jgi:serine/threonine protein kinase|nr:serine/threonine protein kinase [Kastovskya adunca ATA6-11-RM4]